MNSDEFAPETLKIYVISVGSAVAKIFHYFNCIVTVQVTDFDALCFLFLN
ncbi:hypothetical protein X975_21281, partial [Stegodyphus mimosarum]